MSHHHAGQRGRAFVRPSAWNPAECLVCTGERTGPHILPARPQLSQRLRASQHRVQTGQPTFMGNRQREPGWKDRGRVEGRISGGMDRQTDM